MQLPSVQVDNVTEEITDLPFVTNRNPQPNEAQVAHNARIQFDIYGSFADALVYVNDVLVMNGSIPSSVTFGGWLADVVATPDNVGTRVSLRPPADFATAQAVEVNVESLSNAAAWTFNTYDLVAPLIASVQALNETQLRVRFNEAVYMADGTESNDALNPASYFIERVSRPAATPTVIAVELVSATEVVLTTAFELTFGARYMLVVSDVEDEFGNSFDAPTNVLEFDGWLPPFPAGRRWLLHDHVPAMSLVEDVTDDLKLFLACLQDTNNLLLSSIDRWLDVIDPDIAPETFVDAMLIDLGNPFDFDLTLMQKRRLAKSLVLMYKLKGTSIGIRDVVRFFLHLEVQTETFTGRGWHLGYDLLSTGGQLSSQPAVLGPDQHALYSFRLLSTDVLTATQRDQIFEIGQYMKGAQEHLIGIRDASPVAPTFRYWLVGKTKLGYVRLSDVAVPPTGSTTKQILSFTLSD